MAPGLKDIAFYAQKHIAPRVVLSEISAGSREADRGACIYETGLFSGWLQLH